MGKKGAKLSGEATDVCDQLVQRLAPLGDVSSRKMFGGYGIFESQAMFALVDSQGEAFLKVDDTNRAGFDHAGSRQHGKMPYFQIPSVVLEDDHALREWAKVSIDIAHAGKAK